MSQVSYGTITITDTNDIESIVIEYNKNQDNQNPPSEGDSNWSTSRPTWQQGYYIWQRARIHKSGTAVTADIIGTPVCVTGSTGEQGQPGTAGRSLTGVQTEYCIYGTGTPSDSYSGWQDTIPEYNSSTPNYWVKVTNTYSEAPITEVVKYKDTGITNAMAKAADAQSRAATAETNASNALNLSQATQQHFWFNSVKTGDIEAGAYITDVVVDSFKPNKSGNYLLAGSNGIELGNGSHPYMQLTASELNFFHPNNNTIDAQLSSNGLVVKSGGIEAGTVGQDGGIYLSTKNYGITHNNQAITINGHEATNWRQIIGTKFGVDSDGVLYAGGANIQGKITVTSGSNVYTTDEVNPLDVGGRNLIISFTTTIGSILNSSGKLIDNPRGVVSDLIEIQPNEKYVLQYWLPNNLTDTGTDRAWNCKICWYGQEGTASEETTEEIYISGYTAEYFSDYKVYFGVAPTNAKYCRVCFELPASYQDGEVSQEWINGDDGYRWKLEQGTIATDWTLAPEDTNNIAEQQDLYLLTDNEYNYENVNYNYMTKQSGDIISIDDAVLEYPTESLIVNIEPIQKLNGYDAPWVGGAGKNLFYINPQTLGGITVTLNEDGSYKLNGSATNAVFLRSNSYNLKAGQYRLSASSSSSSGYYIRIRNADNLALMTTMNADGGNGVNVSISEDTNVFWEITVLANTTLSNVNVYPQLEKGSVKTAFEPYTNICPISGHTSVETHRTGKNLLPSGAVTETKQGVTFTAHSDGTITVNGKNTGSGTASFYIQGAGNTFALGVGSYILSGCPSGGGSSTYFMSFYYGNNGGNHWGKFDFGSGQTYTLTDSTNTGLGVRIGVAAGVTANNLVFKPMLRLASDTDDAYEPYNGQTYTTALGRTVYGGTLDVVSGELVVDRAMVSATDFTAFVNGQSAGGLHWIEASVSVVANAEAISSMLEWKGTGTAWRSSTECFATENGKVRVYTSESSLANFKTKFADLVVVYELATPQTYQLTPQQITLLAGENHMWSDGEITIKYITTKPAEWSPTYQTPDQYNPYIWWKYILTYSSGQIYESTPVIFNSIPQGQIDELTQQINNHNSEINDINNVTVNLGNQYNSLSTGQEKITNQLANYEKNITIDSKMPMIKVYSRTATEESSVTVYSNNVIIKGGGNTTTEINSEGLKTNTIETQTLMPKNNNIGHLAFIARQNGHLSLKVVS